MQRFSSSIAAIGTFISPGYYPHRKLRYMNRYVILLIASLLTFKDKYKIF
jgi:hypothetical protein